MIGGCPVGVPAFFIPLPDRCILYAYKKYSIRVRCREKVACGHKTRLICARYYYCGHIYMVEHAQLPEKVACGYKSHVICASRCCYRHKYLVKCAQEP